MKPPFIKLRIGELYGSKDNELLGFIRSLTYSFPDNTTWETTRGKRVPKLITVAISYQVVHASVPGITYDNALYGGNNAATLEMTSTRFTGYAGNWYGQHTPDNLKNKIQPDMVFPDGEYSRHQIPTMQQNPNLTPD